MKQEVKAPGPLLNFLQTTWPEIKRGQWKIWLKHSAIRVNGAAFTRYDHALQRGDVVRIETRKYAAPTTQLPSGIRILHEDEVILVVEKPEGLLTMASPTEKEKTLYWKINALLQSRNLQKPERVFIVHRLDRDTSGVIVLAKTPEAKRRLQENWDRFEKIYTAVVEGGPTAAEGTFEDFLDESDPMRVRVGKPNHGLRKAVTYYRVLKTKPPLALLEIRLETGRRHQIRVQLSSRGWPVAGDSLYHAKTNPFRRLGLHARLLTFMHPGTRKTMTFESPVPPEMLRAVEPKGLPAKPRPVTATKPEPRTVRDHGKRR